MSIQIQDTSETIEVEVFKPHKKEAELKVEVKEEPKVDPIDPIDSLLETIKQNVGKED